MKLEKYIPELTPRQKKKQDAELEKYIKDNFFDKIKLHELRLDQRDGEFKATFKIVFNKSMIHKLFKHFN